MAEINLPKGEGQLRSSPIPKMSIVESFVLRLVGSVVLIAVVMFVDVSAGARLAVVALCSADLAAAFVWRHVWQRHPQLPVVAFAAAEGMAIATALAYLETSWSIVALFGYLMCVAYLGAMTGRGTALAGGAVAFVLAVIRESTLPTNERLGAVAIAIFGTSIVTLIAYTNAHSFRQARTAESLERLNLALRTVTSKPDLDATLSSIAGTAREAIRAEHTVIQLREADHLVVAAGGWIDEQWPHERFEKLTRWELASVDRTPLARAVNFGETVVVPDLSHDDRFPEWVAGFGARVNAPDMRTLVTVPLRVNDEILGAFTAFFRHRDLADAETVRLLQTYAEHVTLTIVRAQAYHREHQLAVRLREADRLKSEFVALASHQLRTPLTATKGFIDTVLLQWDRLDDGTRRNLLQRASASASELGRMLAQLLDLSRIESDTTSLVVEPLHLYEIVDDIVTSLMPVLRHEIVVDIPTDLVAMVDHDAFGHVVDNLVANALKFSEPGTRVTISGARDGDEVFVEVTDQGPGIALEEQERIFERFYRPAPSTGAGGGTGLGLAIAHRYVEALGGRIWVESEPGAGATFVFSLPAPPGPRPKRADLQQPDPEQRGPGHGLTPDEHPAKLDQPV